MICSVVSVSAYSVNDDGQRIFYLYRDFRQVGLDDEGNPIMRFSCNIDSNYLSVSSLNESAGTINNNFITSYGGTVSWTGVVGYSYWVNNYVLGSLGDEFGWKHNLIYLGDFQSQSELTIGYSMTGANIADDHHDIFIHYYDENFNFVEQIQYSTPNVTQANGMYLATVPILSGNPDHVYFAVNLQFDDIYPISNGTITFDLRTCALTTTGTNQGFVLDSINGPARPQLPEYSGELKDVIDKEHNFLEDIKVWLEAGLASLENGLLMIKNIEGSFATVAGLFLVFMQVPFVNQLLILSLSLGLLAALLSIPLGTIAAHGFDAYSEYKGRYASHRTVRPKAHYKPKH